MRADRAQVSYRKGRIPAVLSWSSGKDAAHTLFEVRRQRIYEVVALLTTVERLSGRVATHGVRGELLEQQAASVDIPLLRVPLPPYPTNVVYEAAIASVLRGFREQGVRHVIFGDLFLEDLRRYRERQLSELDMQCVFPLWGRDSRTLAQEMLGSGLEACVVSADTHRLPPGTAGRAFDATFLNELPAAVDPCGENGEFHTFVTAGPVLRRPVPVRVGSVHVRDGFATADLRPTGPARERPRRGPSPPQRGSRRKG